MFAPKENFQRRIKKYHYSAIYNDANNANGVG